LKTPADNKYLLKFGKNLKRIRNGKKISQRKLAAKSKIDDSKISKIEKGQINITFTTVLALAKGLEVPPLNLLDYP